MNWKIFTIVFIAVFIAASQVLALDDAQEKKNTYSNYIYLKGGVDPATMIAIGYERDVCVLLDRLVTVNIEWKFSPCRFSYRNSELKSGGTIPVFELGKFRMINSLYFSVGHITTQNFDSTKFSIGDEVAIGFYSRTWHIAAIADYEKIFLNYINHSDFYRKTYYEDAQDGWYAGAGGVFQFGLHGGVSFHEQYDLFVEIKYPITENFNSYGGSPLHVNMGIGIRF